MIKRPLTEIKLEMEDVEKFKAFLQQTEQQKSMSSKPSVKTSLFGGASTHGKHLDDSFPFINSPATSIPEFLNPHSLPRPGNELTRRVTASFSPLDEPTSFAERLRRETHPDVPISATPAAHQHQTNRNLVRQMRLGFSPEVMTNSASSPMNSTPGANVAQYR